MVSLVPAPNTSLFGVVADTQHESSAHKLFISELKSDQGQ